MVISREGKKAGGATATQEQGRSRPLGSRLLSDNARAAGVVGVGVGGQHPRHGGEGK